MQCDENSGGMAAMPRGKLSKSEESYRKCMFFPYVFPHFLLLSSTISSFLDNVLHFFLLIPPFFLCCQSCSNISPHNIFCITFLIFPHSFLHFSSQLSSVFLTTFSFFCTTFLFFSHKCSSFFPTAFLIFKHVENIKKVV